MSEPLQLIECNYERHGQAILDIFNDAILNSTALYDYKARTMDTMKSWFAHKEEQDYPVIGVENSQGQLMGFASYGSFRDYPANKYTLEHSVYVNHDFRKQGIAQFLIKALIEQARAQNYHTLIGSIDAANTASIQLHEKLGFTHAGTIQHAGFKFGHWLDLVFYQLILDTPTQPEDDR